ncbi:Aste57867_12231 [Aphanomyces stellatus]|uniref:Aste57867_12231 protein n=1 Tax=Aphanomyces stellatus TaxID=120398 RepID=A0A485KV09_9STRA|nr:hypothetical protein As57867_012186 [Aphanomyces stellatus]VFT89085.1 Aste57867_12231 [Aphanomyces stellatus]
MLVVARPWSAAVSLSTCWFGPDHCFHETSDLTVCAYVYAAAALFALYIHVHRRSRLREHGRDSSLLPARRMRFFPLLLFLAFVSRLAWLLLHDVHAMQFRANATAPYEHVLVVFVHPNITIDLYPAAVVSWGKLSTLVYFSAFSLILQFWSDVLHDAAAASATHSHHHPSVSAKPASSSRRNNLLAIVNVWMYVLEVGQLLAKTFEWRVPPWVSNADGAVIAAFYGAMSIMLAIYALRLRLIFARGGADMTSSSAVSKTVATRVTIIGLLSSALFVVRSVLFFASPKDTLDHAYPWMYYAMPELVPGCAVLLFMRVKQPSAVHHRRKDSASPMALSLVTERVPFLTSEDVLSV